MTAFLLAVGSIFVTAAACGAVAARLALPRVVGEMAAGLLLGESLLGHVWPRAEHYLFSGANVDLLRTLGTFLVLLYIAFVGAEIDLRVLRGRNVSVAAAVVIAFGAALAGATAIHFSLSDLAPKAVPGWTYFVFLTGALLVTAVPVLARLLDETGLLRSPIGSITLTLSVADDFVAFSAIAIAIAAATRGSLGLAIGGSALLAALALPASVPVVRRSLSRASTGASILGVGVLLLIGGAIESMGASTLVAAFIVGALLWRAREHSPLRARQAELIRVLVPLYIVYAGLPSDVSRLAQPRLAVAIVIVTALAVVTKGGSCLIAGRLLSLSGYETVSLAVLRNTRGLTELVALNLGFHAGLLSRDLYTVFFAMALLTTAASGMITLAALRPVGRREVEERAAA